MASAYRSHRLWFVAATSLLVAACAPATRRAETPENPYATDPALRDNALLAPWTGPLATPPFDRLDLADVEPALRAAMAEKRAELNAIAANRAAPTFENTIVAIERAGRTLDRVLEAFSVLRNNLSTPEVRALHRRLAPELAAFSAETVQNERLFQRVKAVSESRATPAMRPDQQRLVRIVYDRFARNGAGLDGEAKAVFAQIDARLAKLRATFADNVLHDEDNDVVFVERRQLAGMPSAYVAAAAETAAAHGRAGGFAVANTRTAVEPFLRNARDRTAREAVWRAFTTRGEGGDDGRDNGPIISEILALRRERARLLGFETYADWRLANRMARTPARAIETLEAVWPAARARFNVELETIQTLAGADAAASEAEPFELEPWDYAYYEEKARLQRFDLSSDELKPYLALENVREAAFHVARTVFGFEFAPASPDEAGVFHEDVSVWRVADAASGETVGVWWLDPFARAGKRSGAWASSFRERATLDGATIALASTNANFSKPSDGAPALLSLGEAETLFHEFGHALHLFSSDVAYPTLNRTVRDYGEFHAQLLERWLLDGAVTARFLRHHETGEPMPPSLVAKVRAARTFGQGARTTAYLASALIDMRLHTTPDDIVDAAAFEDEALAALDMPRQIAPRHRPAHFRHAFAGESYAAGYYSYLWADILTADAAEALEAAPGGLFDPDLSARLKRTLFAPRNAVDPRDAFRAFRGRDARIDALLRRRGLVDDRREATLAADAAGGE
ncbi:MAG: M3 family metallopeptidase [Parvularculaceae bacterium]